MQTNIPPNEENAPKRFNFFVGIIPVVVSALGLWVVSACIRKPKSDRNLTEPVSPASGGAQAPYASGSAQPPPSSVPQGFHPTEILEESLKDAKKFLTQIDGMEKNRAWTGLLWNDFKDFLDECEPRDTYIKLNRVYGTLKKAYRTSNQPSQKWLFLRVTNRIQTYIMGSAKRTPQTSATSSAETMPPAVESNQEVPPSLSGPDFEQYLKALYLKTEEKLDNRFCHLLLVRMFTVVLVIGIFLFVYWLISAHWSYLKDADYEWVAGLGLSVGVAIDLFRKESSAYVPRDSSVQTALFGSPEKWKERVHDVKKEDFLFTLTLFSHIRDMIVNEDGLVNHRISWQIAVQVGLVAACVSLKEYLHSGADVPLILRWVPIVGMVFSLFCFVGVKAAFEAVKVFRESFQVYKEVLLPDLEAMPRTVGDRYVARRGAFVGFAYALLPGLMWLIASVNLIVLHDRYLIHEQKALQYAMDEAIIQGQVLDQASGTRLKGVIITCRVHQSFTPTMPTLHRVSDASGNFLFRRPPGTFDIGVDGIVNGQVATVTVDGGTPQLMRLPTDTLAVDAHTRQPTMIVFRLSRIASGSLSKPVDEGEPPRRPYQNRP